MADQKAMKKRLKALMQRPENQVCSDCPEKRPTWASLIVPPPGAPPGTEKIGSFMCLECSGAHRRLGVHISFVRSINLDSWKEWEVRAMENGGNAKVNAIFEAKLAQSGKTKPTNLADGPTRERYIRDKYERRKFYDPAGFAIETGSAITASRNVSDAGNFESQSRPGAPSDTARRRVANRQARMKPHKSNVVATKVSATKVAQAPISVPVEFDLLDFGSETTTSLGQTSSVASNSDLFSSQPVLIPAGAATQTNHFSSGIQKSAILPASNTVPPAAKSTFLAQELLNNPASATKTTTSNDDIMALFGPSKQQQLLGFGMQNINQMRPSSSVDTSSMMANGIMSQHQNQTHQGNMISSNNQQNMMMASNNQHNMMMASNNQQNMMSQQQQQMMNVQNNNMMVNGNQMIPNQMMQQQMANHLQSNTFGAMSNLGMYNSATNRVNNFTGRAVNNSNNMESAIQGIQNINMGNASARQTSDDGGFGTPMGGSSQQQNIKNDAFSSLGGMNAFR